MTEKYPQLELPKEGKCRAGKADVEIDSNSNEHGSILRWVLHEDDQRSRWITTLMAIVERDTSEGWLWIDIENVHSQFASKIEVAAPKLAGSLLAALSSSHRGPIKLRANEIALGPAEMPGFAERLEHPERDLPLVVFSPDYGADPSFSIERAQRSAVSLAGVAQVHLLVPTGELEFRALMGRELGVWSGACRVYMPGIDLNAPDSWRHRYFLSRNLGSRADDAAKTIARYLSPRVARQRAPQAYVDLRSLLDVDHETQIQDLWDQNDQLEAEKKATLDDYLNAATEADDFSHQLGTAQQNLRDVWIAIEAAGVLDVIATQMATHSSTDELARPEPPETCAEVPSLALQHLRLVAMPAAAPEGLNRLDNHLEGPKWARIAWRGLVALDTYARDKERGTFAGGFYEWCESSGSDAAWPTKKLSMVESDSVRNTPRFRDPRVRPVDERVRPEGQMFMEAHLKVAEGGGMLAPRIYFHDDTGHNSDTRMVHVGFFGPHDLVPNKSAN
ncbi:hypothetical protein [Candidatus Poriferisodalis sp.]|uniref:hypothetical protein n=1 Tax=Candidatus Poriferisodalis sp. TaxID=3101277 RepID=UPI003B58DE78